MRFSRRPTNSCCRIVLAFLLFFARSVHAQLLSTADQRVFEGQIVSAVELIGNPHRDLRPLRFLLEQKSGDPYSEAKVQASVAAFEKQAGFKKVMVEVVSNAAGLEVKFVLEPPYYVGIITFPEVSKRFSYTQLLRVVALSEDEPYNAAHLPLAEAALARFFRNEGFFQAKAKAVPEINDSHQLVSVTFHVQLGQRTRIRSVEIKGVSDSEQHKLLRHLASTRTRVTGGHFSRKQAYSATREKAAIAAIKRQLSGRSQLSAKIESDVQHDTATNCVDVSFRVTPGPVIKVRVIGARLLKIPFLSRREVRKIIPIYAEGSVDRNTVENGRRNLISYFKNKGFYDVEVNAETHSAPEQISIVYKITKRTKHKIQRICFTGAHHFSEQELLSHVALKESSLWHRGRLGDKLLAESRDNLEALYQDEGYEHAKVVPKISDVANALVVTFAVDEGAQTLVDDLELLGNDHISKEQLAGREGFQLQPGRPFSNRKLLVDQSRISATYLNHGYLACEVNATVHRHPDNPSQVNVRYRVVERQRVLVSSVTYLGHSRTSVSLLEKTTLLRPRVPMTRGGLLQAESRLYGLNIFDWSSVAPGKPILDQADETTMVRMHESKRNDITYGFGFEVTHRGGNVPAGSVPVPGIPPVELGDHRIAPSQATYAGPRGSIEWSRRNIRGLGETVSTLLLLSRLDQQVVTTYSQPAFLGTQWSSLASVSLERTTENPLYAAGLGTASFQVERLLKPKTNTRFQLRYSINKTNLWELLVPDLVLPRDRNVVLSTIASSLIRDTRDNALDAHRGTFSTFHVGLTPAALGSSATFTKLFTQYSFYKPVSSLVFANSVRVGLAKALAGSFVPASELFYSGGGTSLRSFPINQAGPQRIVPFCNVLENTSGCVDITVPVGGRQLFIMNSELRFPIPIKKKLGGVILYDGGNVYRAINLADLFRNYTHTIGFGVRYSTPIGPIRIDVAHNLNPVPGINPTQYYITLGQAF